MALRRDSFIAVFPSLRFLDSSVLCIRLDPFILSGL
jgi:hypothetical protein